MRVKRLIRLIPRRRRPNQTLTLARQAVFFTENLRHGGFTNTTDVPRLTVHVGYGPGEQLICSLPPSHQPGALTIRLGAQDG